MSYCRTRLALEARVTKEVLEDVAEWVLAMPSMMIPEPRPSRDDLLRHLEAAYAVVSDDHSILEETGYLPWLQNRKADIEWRFWNRYRQYLEEQVRLAPDTINRLDNLTDDILNHLIDPTTSGPWDRRGMVVGQVQSGKTGNYIGLINKAADAGFRVIVILAGIHDSLRAQTQIRVDQGFLGFDTQTGLSILRPNQWIGAGTISKEPTATPLTSSALNGDFNGKAAGFVLGSGRPVVLVVKKNAHILRSLVNWMGARGDQLEDGKRLVQGVPLLVIDDEADNASINVSKDYVSTINGLVRALLAVFEQRAYVGYTATPFANIFIPLLDQKDYVGLDLKLRDANFSVGQDLFPRDFIINIPPPSNYIGPARVFGLEPLATSDREIRPMGVAHTVNDYTDLIPDRHRKDGDLPDRLPDSLHRAVKCFLLTCAARAARGQVNVHNSMLVHVSRFIRWQDQIATLLDGVLKGYQRRIEFAEPAILAELEAIWRQDYEKTTRAFLDDPDPQAYRDPSIRELTWKEVAAYLKQAALKVTVRAVHGDGVKGDSFFHDISPLDYFAEETRGSYLSVIAVGGDRLSRGLTLEGLSVSYYLRASRMYDTLMQMGRWFGYRPGYADLCRLFTSTELQEWYRHITVASEELRREFDFMVALHRTPRDYGLKIRSHPGVLKITAANKFRHAEEMDLSYSNTLAESYRLSLESENLDHNRRTVLGLLDQLPRIAAPPGRGESSHLYFGGPDTFPAVQNFLLSFRVADEVVDGARMAEYIGAQVDRGSLREWTVVLVTRQRGGARAHLEIQEATEEIGVLYRKPDENLNPLAYWIRKNHIISPDHEALDLDDQQYQKAVALMQKSLREREKKVTGKERPSGEMMRYVRGSHRGLLLIYPLTPEEKPEGEVEPVFGYAVSFPYIENDQKVRYAVNRQFQQQLDYEDEAEEVLEDA